LREQGWPDNRKASTTFPTTRVFSDLARLTLPEVNARDNPDAALMAWLTHEEALFRRLERRVVMERLEQGFGAGDTLDVDGFLHFSLQVQNRRKSRMGRAFENQLEAVFRAFDLGFETQAVTEHGNTADFLFPGAAAYHNPLFPDEGLTMLAAKSTCKERWRQVLPEARRIWPKHLITLEPAISTKQTDQMRAERVQLVLPLAIQSSYDREQRTWLLSLSDLIEKVRGKRSIDNSDWSRRSRHLTGGKSGSVSPLPFLPRHILEPPSPEQRPPRIVRRLRRVGLAPPRHLRQVRERRGHGFVGEDLSAFRTQRLGDTERLAGAFEAGLVHRA